MDSDESDVYSEGNPKTYSDSDWEEESEIVVDDDGDDDDDYDDEPPPLPWAPTPPPRRAAPPRPPLPRHPARRQPQAPPPPQPCPEAEERRNGGNGVIRLFGVVISASPAPPSSPVVATKNGDDGWTTRMLPWWDYLTHIVRMVGGDDPVFTTIYAPNNKPGFPTLFPVQYGVTFEQIWWPWADVTTIVAISEFHPADCVAKRTAVEATLKELWGKAGIVVPDFHDFKLKAHKAGDATITTTAVTVCESFKHSSYILRYVADRLGYTVRSPAPLHEFGGNAKIYQAEVKFFGRSPVRRNFSVLGTIENRPYLAILTALLQSLLYLETHEGADIVDVNRAWYLSAVDRLDD
ncbi:hypothetical protein ACP4OV_016072 [Aristida adscensionis]